MLNELSTALPGVEKVVRGKRSYKDLLEEAILRGARYILLVFSRHGNPSALRVIDVERRAWFPYELAISGVKTREDMPAFVLRKPRAASAAIVDYTASELPDILMTIFGYPLLFSAELDKIKGRYDTIVLVRGSPGRYIIELIDGSDLGPRGLILKIKAIKLIRNAQNIV